MDDSGTRMALRVAAAYALLASAYIVTSDRLLDRILTDAAALSRAQTAKGWAFVFVTTVLLFVVLRIEERARHQAQTRYQRLFDASADAVAVTDSTGRILDVNRTAVARYGYSREELLAMTTYELTAPDLRQRLADHLQRASAEGDQYESRHRRKDGSEIWVEVAARPIVLDGQRCVLSSARDITQLTEARRALQKQTEMLQQLGRTAQVGGWEFDAVTGEGAWTEEAARIHDLDLNARTSVEAGLSVYTPESRGRIEAAIRDAVENARPYDIELEMATAAGNRKWVRTIGRPILEGDRVVRVLGTFQDITGHKRAEAEIRELNAGLERRVAERTAELAVAMERAQESDRLKSAFLATMSHELRTPLNSIIGFTGILLQGLAGPLNAEQGKQLGMVQNSARHLLALINDVLDISKIEADKVELRPAPTDIRELAGQAADTVLGTARTKGLHLTVNVAPEVPGAFFLDQSRLKQVLINLLGNAVKFTHEGGVSFSIRCEEAEEDRCLLRFSVEDTGIGIRPESMERLFEPFFQADVSNTRKYGGTGLGLSICSALLQMMGSELRVESVPGEGSRFFFDLRAERVPVLETAEEERARIVPEEPFMPATRPTILIIEDEELNRRLLRLLLSKLLDADIVEAEGGEEGVERFRERAPDLIFLDLQMPGRDGHWTARTLRELEGAGVHTPIVAFTADVQPATREACFASGMDDYICKPADLYTLREVLERHLKTKT